MHEYILRNWRLVKIATTKAQRKLFFNLRSMKTRGTDDADARGSRRAWRSTLRVKPRKSSRWKRGCAGRTVRSSRRMTTTRKATRRSPIWPTRTTSRAAFSSTSRPSACTAKARAGAGSLDPRSRRIIETRWLQRDRISADAARSGRRVRRVRRAHPPDRSEGDEEDAQPRRSTAAARTLIQSISVRAFCSRSRMSCSSFGAPPARTCEEAHAAADRRI